MEIEHDRAGRRFRVEIDGAEARLFYRDTEAGVLDILSTFVPPELRGQGVGARLVEAAAAFAREGGREIETTCWYAEKVLDRLAGES